MLECGRHHIIFQSFFFFFFSWVLFIADPFLDPPCVYLQKNHFSEMNAIHQNKSIQTIITF